MKYTAEEILYAKAKIENAGFLIGQSIWIIEAMEEYKEQELKEAEKRNGELVEALEGITNKSNKPQFHNFLIHANQALDNINDIAIKALKNNNND